MSQINLTRFAKMDFGIFEMLGKAKRMCSRTKKQTSIYNLIAFLLRFLQIFR